MARLTPSGLIECAWSLVPTGRGRPAEAALRRAISTAYYAVFCALGEQVASPYGSPLNLSIRRLVAHRSAFDVLDQLTRRDPVTGSDLLQWHPQRPICHPDLAKFGRLFCELLTSREQADYDHLWTAAKRDAVDAVGSAEAAVDCLHHASRQAPAQVQAVCVAIIAGSAGTRRRLRH